MQDSHLSPTDARSPASRPQNELLDARVYPSSSRMLANYLADVEQNLDEQRWEMALRDVIDLPRIAVALANPEMQASREQCVAWCEQWIRPPEATTESGVDHEHICRVLDEKTQDESAVPSVALRRLRLRRHARNAPRGFGVNRTLQHNEDHAETFGVCTAVVEGVRRWYAHFACHDATAQANLARLAVLR